MSPTKTKTAVAAAPSPEPVLAAALATLLADGLTFASTDGLRPVIAAVHLERTHDRLTIRATDSYTAVEVWREVETGTPWTFLLSRWDAELAVKLLRSAARDEIAVLEVGETPAGRRALTIDCRGARLQAAEVKGAWPAVADLIASSFEKRGSAEKIALNPSFANRAQRLSAAKDKPVVYGFGSSNVQAVSFTIGDTCRGLIMPVRVS